jgi:hypothetical protein
MRRARAVLVALLCLPLIACFEEPVRERLNLFFAADGEVVVTALQQVAEPERAQDNPELAERMDSARDEIETGLDRWSRRFRLLEPLAEHLSLERVEGALRRSVHSAALASFKEAVQVLEADGLSGDLQVDGEIRELQLFPTGGSRATSRQRDEAERRLSGWSGEVADYLGALIDLYSYLDGRPDRAVPCLAHIFDKHEDVAGSGPLAPAEEELVRRVKESMEEVADALIVTDEGAYSLNELTRLVYDPFPARLTVVVQGTLIESEGFIRRGNTLERPSVDAWSALVALQGRWAAPDLVTLTVVPGTEDMQPDPDPTAIASLPRHFYSKPTGAEVEAALLSELVPMDVHLARWRQLGTASDEAEVATNGGLDLIAEAEASIPE